MKFILLPILDLITAIVKFLCITFNIITKVFIFVTICMSILELINGQPFKSIVIPILIAIFLYLFLKFGIYIYAVLERLKEKIRYS